MRVIFSISIVLMSLFVHAQEVNISGDWTMTYDTPQGKRSSSISIKQEGNKAPVWSSEGEYIMTIDGENISWSHDLATPMGAMTAAFTGKISDANKMSGKASFSQGPLSGRSMSWYAIRKQTEEEKAKKEKKKKKDN